MEQGRIEWQRCPVCKRWGFMETLETPDDILRPFGMAIPQDNITVSCDSGTTDTVDVTEMGVEGQDWDYTKAKLGAMMYGGLFVVD